MAKTDDTTEKAPERKPIALEKNLLTALRVCPRNKRKHPPASIEAIQKSIERFGFVNPIIAKPDGEIIAGEGRYRAAKRIGLKEVPVIVVDMGADEALAYLVVDNATTDMSEWDLAGLEDVALELAKTSFDLRDLGGFDFLNAFNFGDQEEERGSDPPEAEMDRADELQQKWGTAVGQVWGIGPCAVCPSCGKVHDLK